MVSYDGTITLKTLVDTKGIKTGASQIKSGLSGIGPMLGKIGAAVGIAFGVAALINFGKQSVKLASDLQEVQNVVDVAFGDMTYKMEEFANTAIETYGISRLTAKNTGSSYMAMAVGMGMARDAASDMSLQLTALSADMSSFYNISQDESRVALSAVFTGETETLKRYGILITEVNLQEYARQQGITKSINAMTQQEKVMLRYNYIMQQTALAQGDFARTSLSWANQTRVLTERWNEMKTAFGEAFISIGTLILPAINTLIKGLTYVANLAKVAAVNIAALFGKKIDTTSANVAGNTAAISSGLGSAADNAADTAGGVGDVGKAAKKANKEISKTVAAFDELQILASDAADSAGGGSGGAGGGGIGGAGGVSEVGAVQDSGKSPGEYADETINALARIGEAVGKALMVIGVILLLTGNIGWGLGCIAVGAAIYGVSEMALAGSDPSKDTLTKLEILKSVVAPALLALGVVCIFLGAVPIGIGLIVVGAAIYGVRQMKEQSGKDPALTAVDKLNIVLQAAGAALIAIGVILLFLGQIPIGLGFIIMGATLFNISSQQLNENGITTKVSTFLKDNQNLIVGISLAMLIIGTIMMACGIITPLSLGLVVAGAVGLASMAAINNTTVSTLITTWIKDNSGLIVGISLALLVLGIVLCCCGVITPLSIGLIAAGAVGLATVVVINWDYIKTKTTEVFNKISNWVTTWGLLILGIILVFTGAGIPLGLGLIKKGAQNLAKADDPLWDTIYNKIVETWNNIKTYWKENIAEWFTVAKWEGLAGKCGEGLKNGFTSAIETIKTIFKNGINWIIGKLNKLSFKIPDIPGIPGGGETFGINIPPLAQGAVLPPNKPFMAMVGDQTSGTNVEAPLDTIKQALIEAMQTSGGGNQPIIIEIDGREFGRAVLTQGNRESKRTSGKLVFA